LIRKLLPQKQFDSKPTKADEQLAGYDIAKTQRLIKTIKKHFNEFLNSHHPIQEERTATEIHLLK